MNPDTTNSRTRAGGVPIPVRRLLSSVHQAKLRPATNPEYLVPRPRLNELLHWAVGTPLTLVVAPAGSGKTSLLRDWVAVTELPHTWLSLDESDRDPVQLWLGILAALEVIAPGCAVPVVDVIRRQGALLEAVGTLLDDLEARSYDARILVIDDLQFVDGEDSVAATLAIFVQHLPMWLRVVVASRHVPRLPLDRLRARSQLTEVRFSELRFSQEEAAAMLARLAPDLPVNRVREVAARAGGWAASIQLAALAARSSHAQAGLDGRLEDGTGRYLENYIWHELLADERPDVVDVLLSTAVVDRVEPDLARVLANRADAPELLELAEERGLFVARIEPTGAFEMHTLVRDVLLAKLRRLSPERFTEQHRLAARWFEEHRQPTVALEHLTRAGLHRDALRVLADQVAGLYDSGRESTVRRTLDAIPASVASVDFDATLELAWCHLLIDRGRFLEIVEFARAWADDILELDQTLLARLDVLRSIAATIRGDWTSGASLARSALEGFGEEWPLDPLGQFCWNLVARNIALSEAWDETGAEARRTIVALSVLPERRITLEGTRALGNSLAGHPVDALRVVAGARAASEVANMTILRAELSIAEALARRELGEGSAALPTLLELADTDLEPVPYCRLLACLELTRVWLDDGNLVSAERAFGQATEIVDTEVTGPCSRSWLARTGTMVALAAERLEAARGWAAQVEDPFWTGVVTARVLIAEGELGPAGDALKTVEPRCARHRVVRALLLSRTAADAEEAEAALLEGLDVATEQRMVQTIASEGVEVVESIERLAWKVPPSWLDRLRRAPIPDRPASSAPTLELVEALTDREYDVLRMLPSRLTLREIADELFISVNTLKSHLRVIYRKLGCASRAEAAELARSMASLRWRSQASTMRRR